jgi:hypothetical protein
MSIKTVSAAARTATVFGTFANEFKGRNGDDAVTIKVAPDGEAFSKLNFGVKTWAKLFTVDAEGDSNLANLFGIVHGEAASHEEADVAVKAALRFCEQFKQWYAERFSEEPAAEETVVEEPTPEPLDMAAIIKAITDKVTAQLVGGQPFGRGIAETPDNGVVREEQAVEPTTEEEQPTADEMAKYARLLRTQSRIWRTCKDDAERDALAADAWKVCRGGLAFSEYVRSLKDFTDAAQYLAEIS